MSSSHETPVSDEMLTKWLDLANKDKRVTKGKKPLRDFDLNREVGPDLRDPRMSERQWPCFGKHIPYGMRSNAHGQWAHCQTCNLRLVYVPRMGSPATPCMSENGAMVQLMLAEVRAAMQDVQLTAEICLNMQRKVTQDLVVQQLVEARKSEAAKSKGYSTRSSSPAPSGTSWDLVGQSASPSREDILAMLTAEEKAHIVKVAMERKEAQTSMTAPMRDLAEAYAQEQ